MAADPFGTVDPGNTVDPVIEELVGALSEANEQRLGLERLAQLSKVTLNQVELIDTTLHEIVDLLGARAAAFVPDGCIASSDGSGPSRATLDGAVAFDPAPSGSSRSAPSDLVAWRQLAVTVTSPLRPADSPGAADSHGPKIEDPLVRLAAQTEVGTRSSRVADGNTIVVALAPVGRMAVQCRSVAGTGERKLVEAAAAQLGSALQLADLHERAVADAIVRTEHDRAAELARSVLNASGPTIDGLEVAVRSEAARSAGGDLHLQVRHGDDVWFAVGDVAGKGLPAAVVMAMTVAAAGTAMRTARGPAEVLAVTNSQLIDYLSTTGRFVTLVVARHRIGSDSIDVANAGHSPVLHGQHGDLASLPADAPPIGVLDQIEVTANQVAFSSGHRLILASDGFVEQENDEGEMYGDDRFGASLAIGAGQAVTDAFTALERFAAGVAQSDDRTLCVIDRVDPDLLRPSRKVNP